ncbi:MAG TPA: pseudouridine synthase [Roseiarcus sp.]|jgi:23S rRNA pseudouridine2605 synthase
MGDETQAGVSEVRAGQRIAKVMARAGVCSRRDAEAWIAEGRVTVNGKALLSPAFNVTEADDVRVDGQPLASPERTRLFLFHKPRGLVTTARDPEGRPTVFSALPPGLPRLVAIGRLDINTEGLLLLTNDGGLARVLELPSTGWLRRYRVRVHGSIDQAALDRLSEGVTIDGVDYLGVEAKLDREQGANAWLTLGLREGKNREIKKILEHLGLAVNRLIRLSFGPFELGDLPEGEVMEVRTRVLRDQLGVKLAKEANANFDAPLNVREETPPEQKLARGRSERGGREDLGPKRAAHGRSDRRANASVGRIERDERPRRGPPKPSTPERRRKHVSTLRAEIAADASSAKGPRRRVERTATQDRKGRTVTVERRSREHGVAPGLPGREPAERGRRPSPFESKAGRDGKGRGRIAAPHRAGAARRGAFKRNDERDGQSQGRKPAERKGERTGPRGARCEADRRSDRGSRSDFKPRGSSLAPRDRSARGPSAGLTDERSGRRDRDPGAKTKPPRPGFGRNKNPPSGRGPRRPPRKP